jgi:exonuclease III
MVASQWAMSSAAIKLVNVGLCSNQNDTYSWLQSTSLAIEDDTKERDCCIRRIASIVDALLDVAHLIYVARRTYTCWVKRGSATRYSVFADTSLAACYSCDELDYGELNT